MTKSERLESIRIAQDVVYTKIKSGDLQGAKFHLDRVRRMLQMEIEAQAKEK